VYAVKALNSANEVDFNQEVTILRRLSNEKHSHKHLITLLATYEHKEVYHLIFPWADVDLFGYWARSKGRPKSDMLDDWLIEQCRGLVEGLHTIHRYETFSGTSLLASSELDERDYFQADRRSITTENIDGAQQAIRTLFGRHGDLKPQNILWFPDPSSRGGNGILKISDFGIARFSTKDVWETRKTGRVPNSPTYRSPEYDLNGKLTTACDVWALGCVYLQFVTWYLGGYRYPSHRPALG
jgi:serine/threonine protein kinase